MVILDLAAKIWIKIKQSGFRPNQQIYIMWINKLAVCPITFSSLKLLYLVITARNLVTQPSRVPPSPTNNLDVLKCLTQSACNTQKFEN